MKLLVGFLTLVIFVMAFVLIKNNTKEKKAEKEKTILPQDITNKPYGRIYTHRNLGMEISYITILQDGMKYTIITGDEGLKIINITKDKVIINSLSNNSNFFAESAMAPIDPRKNLYLKSILSTRDWINKCNNVLVMDTGGVVKLQNRINDEKGK